MQRVIRSRRFLEPFRAAVSAMLLRNLGSTILAARVGRALGTRTRPTARAGHPWHSGITVVGAKNDANVTFNENSFLRVILPLCICAFLKAMKPAEPFTYRYFHTIKGLSEHQINDEVYPIWTYSYMFFLVVVGLATEAVGYRLMIKLGILAQLAMISLSVYCESLPGLQLADVFFGLDTALQGILFAYAYRIVPKEYFQQANSFVNSAALVAAFLAGILGQVLYSSFDVPIATLFTVSFVFTCTALVASFFLPEELAGAKEESDDKTIPSVTRDCWGFVWAHICPIVRSPILLFWCIWYALMNAGLSSNESYITTLFFVIDEETEVSGFISAIASLVGAGAVLVPAYMGDRLPDWAEAIALACSVMSGLFAFGLCSVSYLIGANVLYVLFEGMLYLGLAVADGRIASLMDGDAYAMVFGLVMFASLAVQAIFQYELGSESTDIRSRYHAFGYFYFALAAISTLFVAIAYTRRKCNYCAPADKGAKDITFKSPVQ